MSEIERVPIDSVQPHPDNARKGDISAIVMSLDQFGQIPGSVRVQRSTRYIVTGNHTWKAAKQLGWDYIDVVFVDMDDVKARGYLIADNMTSDKATYDKAKLLALVGKTLSNLEGTGFTMEDFESLSEELNAEKKTGGRPTPRIDLEEREVKDDGPEPTREIPLRMAASRIESFAEQVNDLLALWEVDTFTDVVLRSIEEAHERWQASVGVVGRADSSAALPEQLKARSDF